MAYNSQKPDYENRLKNLEKLAFGQYLSNCKRLQISPKMGGKKPFVT